MLKMQKLDSGEKKMLKFLDFFVVHLLLALVKETNQKPTIKRCTPSTALRGISSSSYLSKCQERISWVEFVSRLSVKCFTFIFKVNYKKLIWQTLAKHKLSVQFFDILE